MIGETIASKPSASTWRQRRRNSGHGTFGSTSTEKRRSCGIVASPQSARHGLPERGGCRGAPLPRAIPTPPAPHTTSPAPQPRTPILRRADSIPDHSDAARDSSARATMIERLDPAIFAIESQTSLDDRVAAAPAAFIRRHDTGYCYLETGSHLGGSLLPHLADPHCACAVSID